ncbi:LOW QUALITY PROTEIN: ATP synthase subunit C lysine N-methyltransferase [Colossoma macropomum]|uniref:LOW QUALITY PROTEIN: ATP synthase subunit C lysine N-methyltransferase n=1 Tax=Colossoma macropomum TaxID=42526 RepID=UPI001863BC7E|nr:LOW QUALITY PROTEIN: ATP synthase subunit C lysine N-methyltransferase [Colossoma macropomum]
MEDSVEVILQDNRSKFSHHSPDKPILTAASGALLMSFYGLWSIFALPGFRKVPINLKVPYLPSSGVQTQNVMRLLQGRAGSLADLGSGDGRLVFAASSQGFQCTGFEINSILAGYARVKARWMGIPTTTARFVNKDFWKTNLSGYKNVTVFLAPGVMEVLGRKLEEELGDDACVIACRFPFPDWPAAASEGQGLDQAWAYDMANVRKPQHELQQDHVRSQIFKYFLTAKSMFMN